MLQCIASAGSDSDSDSVVASVTVLRLGASAGNCCRLDVFLSCGPELPVIGWDKCLLGNHRNGTHT